MINLKKKNNNEVNDEKFVFPIKGELTALENVPDPVFAEKMMGDGFAIKPTGGKVYSPVTGKIGSIFPTKHAIGIIANDNLEVLIHFGLETVSLNGEGFTCHVKEGQTVAAGDLLLEVDLESLSKKVEDGTLPSLITPIIFTKLENYTFEVKYGAHEALAENIIVIK